MGRLVVARLDACHCQLCGSTKPSASAYEVHITWTWRLEIGKEDLVPRAELSDSKISGKRTWSFHLGAKNIGKYVTWKKGQ